MSVKSIIMAAAGVVTGNVSWIVKLDTASLADIGYGIAVDTTGNVYVTGQANSGTNSYIFIAKYNTSGVIQWQRSLDTASVVDVGYGIAVDGSGNVYVTGQANTTTAAYIFIAKYDTSGVIQWQRSLDTASLSDMGRGIAVDTTGNVYVTGQANTTTAAYIFIAKYDTSGVIQWQRKLDTVSLLDFGYGIAVDGSGNVYVTGQANTGTSSYCFIAKYDTTGVIQWQRSLDTASQPDSGNAIAVDTTGNVYVTGQATSSGYMYIFIAKYNTSGVIQWQRSLTVALAGLSIGYGIAVDTSGNVYVIGQLDSGAPAYIFIAKYDTSGVIQWQRKLDTASLSDIGYGIAVDTTGNVYVTGQANTTTSSYCFIAKYPADGTIPKTGTYVVGGSTLTYSAATMTDSVASLTDAAGTLTISALSANHWIVQLDTAVQPDVGYGIAVDGSGNVYVTGQANTTTAAYIFIAKYNTSGVIQWQRSLDTASTTDSGNAIAVDGSGNVYVTGQANAASAWVFIAKYDTSGVIQWQRYLDTGSVSDAGNGIAVDGSGNVYVTGNANTTTAAYIFIAKYDTSGVIQWQRKLDTASLADIGYGIAVDTTGNVYVTGQANSGTNSYIFIAKYDTSGVIQWQRNLDTASLADFGYGIAADGSGNVYVTGMANTSTAAYIFIAKYNTSGVIQWQRSLDTASLADTGRGIAVDGSGNVYVTGQANGLGTAATSYIFIAKYNTSGVIQWQRSLDTASTTDSGNAIAVDGSGNVYVTGQANTTTAQYVFIAKLLVDGTILPGTSILNMAASTMVDSASAMTDMAGTMTDSAGIMQSINPTDYWISTTDLAGGGDTITKLGFDSSGNIYVNGTTSNGTTNYSYIAKFNSSGTCQWYIRTTLNNFMHSAVDSNGNLYVSEYYTVSPTQTVIIKFDTTGAIAWQRQFPTTGSSLPITVDGAGNVYGATTTLVYKIDATGALQWIRTYAVAAVVATPFHNITDSNSNVYIAATTGAYGATQGVMIMKYNTAGVFQWVRRLHSVGMDTVGGITLDSSGNVYICGSANSVTAVNIYMFIAKYDPTGVIQWQRTFDTSSASDYGYGIAVDDSDNVYVTGKQGNAGIIYKFSSAGVVIWQYSTVSTRAELSTINLSGSNMYIGGMIGSGTSAFAGILKLPTSSIPITPAVASTITFTAVTLAISTGAMVASTPAMVESASSVTLTTPTYSYTLGTAPNPLVYLVYGLTDSATTMTTTTTIQGIPDAATSITDSVASMTSTTLTL